MGNDIDYLYEFIIHCTVRIIYVKYIWKRKSEQASSNLNTLVPFHIAPNNPITILQSIEKPTIHLLHKYSNNEMTHVPNKIPTAQIKSLVLQTLFLRNDFNLPPRWRSTTNAIQFPENAKSVNCTKFRRRSFNSCIYTPTLCLSRRVAHRLQQHRKIAESPRLSRRCSFLVYV